MKTSKTLIAAVALGALALSTLGGAVPTASAASSTHIISLQVKVSKVGGASIGTFSVKNPAQSVPAKPGVAYHLVLVGTAVVAGKLQPGTAVNATFSVQAGKGKLILSNPGANSTDFKVTKGKCQMKYKVGPGFDMNRSLASGFVTLF
jgi:hypothetical protein